MYNNDINYILFSIRMKKYKNVVKNKNGNLIIINKLIKQIKIIINIGLNLKSIEINIDENNEIKLNYVKECMESYYNITIDMQTINIIRILEIINSELIKIIPLYSDVKILLAIIVFINNNEIIAAKDFFKNKEYNLCHFLRNCIRLKKDNIGTGQMYYLQKNKMMITNSIQVNLTTIISHFITKYDGLYLIENLIDVPNKTYMKFKILQECPFAIEYNNEIYGNNKFILVSGKDIHVRHINYYKLICHLFSRYIDLKTIIAIICDFILENSTYNIYKKYNIDIHCIIRHKISSLELI